MKKSAWIAPSFDDFSSSQKIKKTISRKRGRYEEKIISSYNKQRHKGETYELWLDKHKPTESSELAVHKKKVEDIQKWITDSFNSRCVKGSILLLTGPAGAGKTATLGVLAKEINYKLHEYSIPVTTVYDTYNSDYPRQYEPPVKPETATSHFEEFLLRANRYQSLQLNGNTRTTTSCKTLLLVEDLPNIFYRDIDTFHRILRSYTRSCRSPVVFIVSDTGGSNNTSRSRGGIAGERKLFPPDLQQELNIANISFNPIAQTSMVKALTRILTAEGNQSVDKDKIQDIALSSNGDIRSAINSLQFSVTQDHSLSKDVTRKPRAPVSRRAKGTATARQRQLKKEDSCALNAQQAHIGAKDTTLFLFRALGKILYCKRDASITAASDSLLPPHLAHHHRHHMIVTPEVVVERSNLPGDMFIPYLHQNYIQFYTDVSDVVRASRYLSDADIIAHRWEDRDTQSDYAVSVVTRGLMHSNSARDAPVGLPHASSTTPYGSSLASTGGGGGGGFKPLHKPQWFTVRRKRQENIARATSVFRERCWTPTALFTDHIPHLSLITTPTGSTRHPYSNTHPGEAALAQELCRYERLAHVRSYGDRLNEKDLPTEEDEAYTTGMAPYCDVTMSAANQAADVTIMAPTADDSDDCIEEFSD